MSDSVWNIGRAGFCGSQLKVSPPQPEKPFSCAAGVVPIQLSQTFLTREPTNLPAPIQQLPIQQLPIQSSSTQPAVIPDVHVNEKGGKQSFLLARFDYIPAECLLLLAQCVGFGGMKYGQDNWRNIPIEENIGHAMNHLTQFRAGDTSEPHLVNALTRACFALSQAVRSGIQPREYNHPQLAEVLAKFADKSRAENPIEEAATQGGAE